MTRSGPAAGSDGFTLVEVLAALLLLTTAATGAAVVATASLRAVREARLQTMTAALAVEKVEQLRSLLWAFDHGVVSSDQSTDLGTESPTDAGAGLTSSPTDTLDTDTAGYVDYLSGSGAWLSDGTAPPANAVFVRRWNVRPLDEDPNHTLILQAFVTTVARARQQGGARPDQQAPGDALMTTVLTRTGR